MPTVAFPVTIITLELILLAPEILPPVPDPNVILPDVPIVVNKAELAVTLPIGVSCNPPKCCAGPVVTNEPDNVALDPLILPTTPKVEPIVALLLIVKPLAVMLPAIDKAPPDKEMLVASNVVNLPVLGVVLPIGVACIPPEACSVPTIVALLLSVIPEAVIFEPTPKLRPTVAELLTVKPLTVLLPLTLSLVNIAVLGETLPIGVACNPPKPLIVVIAVIDPLLVNPAPVILPVALTVVN